MLGVTAIEIENRELKAENRRLRFASRMVLDDLANRRFEDLRDESAPILGDLVNGFLIH